jgi:hypothetical protein
MEAKIESIDGHDSATENYCRVESCTSSRTKIFFTPSKPGDYRFNMKWGTFDVPSTPRNVFVHSTPVG